MNLLFNGMNGWVYEAGHLYELMNLLLNAMHE